MPRSRTATLASTAADELMALTIVPGHRERMTSYHVPAQAMGASRAQISKVGPSGRIV